MRKFQDFKTSETANFFRIEQMPIDWLKTKFFKTLQEDIFNG